MSATHFRPRRLDCQPLLERLKGRADPAPARRRKRPPPVPASPNMATSGIWRKPPYRAPTGSRAEGRSRA